MCIKKTGLVPYHLRLPGNVLPKTNTVGRGMHNFVDVVVVRVAKKYRYQKLRECMPFLKYLGRE